jgi:transcriptional regulator with XRE-family HTH domain
MRTNVPRALRALRRRRAWRQVDLARRAHVARDLVQRAEGRRFAGVTVGALERLAEALDAHLVVELRWRGAELDRLMDARHAALTAAAANRLGRTGWDVRPEVSFNHFGDRGRCDLVAWHAVTRTLLNLEVKSQLGDLQDVLGRLDVKVRLGRQIATAMGVGRPERVLGGIVLAANGGNRRIVDRHEPLFRAFAARGRAAFAWLRHPQRPVTGLLWYEQPDAG